MNQTFKKKVAVGEGLEPPQAKARRFSRPLQYHYASPPMVFLGLQICIIFFFLQNYFPKIYHLLFLQIVKWSISNLTG